MTQIFEKKKKNSRETALLLDLHIAALKCSPITLTVEMAVKCLLILVRVLNTD